MKQFTGPCLGEFRGVSCYNGNNDRAARVLFVQHPREQGEWLRQNPRYARVLTASFALLPRVLDEQHPRSPVIIPIITRNSQIRDIFTEIRTA